MTVAEATATLRQAKMVARATILVTRGGTGAARGAATTAVAAGMGALKVAAQGLTAARALPMPAGYTEAQLRDMGESLIQAQLRPYTVGLRTKLADMAALYGAIVDLAGLL